MLVSTVGVSSAKDSTVGAPAPPSSPRIAALSERLRAHVVQIAEPRHLWAQPAANRRAREWIADTLSALGYAVGLQGRYRNVVATPRSHYRPVGSSAPPAVLPTVCAHYDSVPTTPGADDNGSAIAVMLETARVAACAGVPLAVVSFNAEEDDLAGSRDFAACLAADGSVCGFRPSVAHVLEMVGFTADEQRLPEVPRWLAGALSLPSCGDFIGVVADRRSARFVKGVLAAARACAEAPPLAALRAYVGVQRYLPDLLRSDHAPFWQAGIPALMWTDTAEFRNPHYHRPSDTPETLDYVFMARVAQLLARTLEVPGCGGE